MNRLLKLCAMLLITAGPVVAQKQSCPVEVLRTNSNKFVSSTVDPWNSALHIEFMNHAQINAAAIKFGVVFTNQMGEQEQSLSYYVDDSPGKTGQLRKSDWSDGVYTRGHDGLKALAWVERIGFSDGSVWQDDGSRSCGMLNLIQPTKAYQPASGTPAAPAISDAQKEIIVANSTAAKDSAAQQAASKQLGHAPTPEELAELVKQGKASKVAIVTAPSGADVYIDGNKGGVTPLVFVLMKHDAPRTITVKKDGYKIVEKQFDPDGKLIPLDLTLEKQ